MAVGQEDEWQLEKTLTDCMRYMLDNEISTDVCFLVGPPNDETEEIRAHKYMLISRSPVFRAMFSSGMIECIEPEAKVHIEDIDIDTFKELLNYIYFEGTPSCPDAAIYLMYAAKKYMLPKLVKECRQCILKSLNVNNVIHFLEQSFHFDHQELKNDCLKLISINAKDVLTGPEILSASRQVMETVLEAKSMSASELVVYEAAVRWAKDQIWSSAPGEYPTDLMIRDVLGDLLYKIHFPAMKPIVFAGISSESHILTLEEKESIYCYISSKVNNQLKFPTERRIGKEDWVQRTVERSSEQWWSTPYIDAIDFTTDQDIVLTGICLYSGYNGKGYSVDVEILQSVKSLFKKKTTIPYYSDKHSCRVTMPEPILIQAGVLYTVKTLSHDFIGHYGKLCEPIRTKETVTFTFSTNMESKFTTEIYGQIPRLYFCYL